MSEQFGIIQRTSAILADLIGGEIHDRQTISDKFKIAVAAADRYIRQLQRVPGVVQDCRGRRHRIRFDFGEAVPRPSYPAAVAACWAAGLAEVFAGSDYEQGVRDALAYVTRRARRSSEFKHVDRKFIFVARGGESSLPDSSERLDYLVDAVLRSHYADIEYVHFDEKEETLRIQPLSMAIYDHQIYIIGVANDGSRYPYRLSRIKSVDVVSESFEYPERAVYDPKQLFRHSFGIFISESSPIETIRVRLDRKWSVHCRSHRWHESQRIEDGPNGVVVTLFARVCWELKAWILGFGADAVVLEPLELHNEMQSIVAKMAARYETGEGVRKGGDGELRPETASGRSRRTT